MNLQNIFEPYYLYSVKSTSCGLFIVLATHSLASTIYFLHCPFFLIETLESFHLCLFYLSFFFLTSFLHEGRLSLDFHFSFLLLRTHLPHDFNVPFFSFSLFLFLITNFQIFPLLCDAVCRGWKKKVPKVHMFEYFFLS